MRPLHFLVCFLTIAAVSESVVQVPLYRRVRHFVDYYEGNSSAIALPQRRPLGCDSLHRNNRRFGGSQHGKARDCIREFNYDDEYYTIRDVKLGNPRNFLRRFGCSNFSVRA